MFTKGSSLHVHCLALICIATILSFQLLAQEVTGSFSGVVRDPSAASVARATVTATEVDTNNSRAVQTGDKGEYEIPGLQPGTYKITVSQPGFKTYQQNSVTLEVSQHATVDVSLQVGSASEHIEVTEQAPVIQTEDTSVGKVIDSATIVNTPLNSRLNITGLMALAPGIQNTTSQDSLPAYGVTASLNGASSYGAVAFTIDGVTNTSAYLERGYGEFPPLDGIREFKVITSGASAEFGKPNQIVIITKGGTNQFHGTALEFNRNRFLAAKNYFAESLLNPKYNRNEFGGDFSGPIFKNKTFFFVNYEGFRRRQAPTVSSQVPTAAERAGNFGGLGTIIDPYTQKPFPDNTIPANRLNPVTLQLQNLYPVANLPGTGTNLVENVPLKENVDRTSFRIDHAISDKDQISGSFLAGLLGPNNLVGATSKFGGMAGIGEHNYNQSIGWNHIFSPSLISETRVSYLHVKIYRTPQNYQLDVAAIVPGLGAQSIEGAPQLNITNITGISEQGSTDLDQTIQFIQNFTKTAGPHTLKAGFYYLHSDHFNLAAQNPQRGAYNFNGQYSGIAYSDFLLGYPTTTQLPIPSAYSVRYRQNRYQAYVQDEWKVTPTLTVNLGVRYELQWIQPNTRGDTSMFVPGLNEMVVFAGAYPPDTLPLLTSQFKTVLASQVSLPTNLWSYLGQDTNNWAPRVGLAYRLGAKTVMRAAFGMYYNQLPTIDTGGPVSTQIPFGTSETFEQPTGKTPTFTMSNPFPGNGAVPASPVVNVMNRPVTPYTLQYNYQIERQLPGQIGLRVGYVGQRNVKQIDTHGSASSPMTITPDFNAVTPAPGATQARRPIQPYANIYLDDAPIFQSTTNSLQVGAQKRYARGFLINLEYQYVRSIGTEGFINQFNWNDSRGNIAGIRKNVLTFSYSYQLPIGKGKPLFGNVQGIEDKLLSGWVLSGITTAESGSPFSVIYTNTAQGGVSSRANVVPEANLYQSSQSIYQWFNTAAFTAPQNFTYGNSGYDMLWGPGLQNWDASLAKNTHLAERATLQLRLDAFGIFNHPQFSNPASSISNLSTVGKITGAAGNRTVQMGAKLTF